MADGIIGRRILCDACNYRSLGQGQFRNVFSKIAAGSRLDPQGILSKVDGVQIIFQNPVFGFDFAQLYGKVLLLYFPFNFFNARLVGPAFEYIVFQKLLGDGAGPLVEMKSIADALEACTDNTFQVNAVVFIEPLVLNGHKGMLQVFGNFIQGDIDPVRARSHQFGGLSALIVQYHGQIAGRRGINIGDVGSRINNTFENTDTCAAAHYDCGQKADKQCFKEND